MAFSPTGTPLDIVNLYYWQATAFQLYMFEERVTPVTNVTLGSLVGRMEGQVQVPLPGYVTNSDADSERPVYTSEGAENAYVIFNTLLRHRIQNSKSTFRFFYEEALRKFTIAFKVRFPVAIGSVGIVLDSTRGSGGNIGLTVWRNTDGTIFFWITNGAGGNILSMTTTTTITDAIWHDIVIKSNGDAVDAVSIKIDDEVSPLLGSFSGFLADASNMTDDITLGGISLGAAFWLEGELSDLIILDVPISTQDETDWRAYSQIPTIDPIAPISGGWSRLINSEEASITVGLINARAIG